MVLAAEIINVSKRYGNTWALHEISVGIKEAEAVAVLGPNGAGKSTLIKILATHALPSEGTVSIFGSHTAHEGQSARKNIGLVAHQSFLYDELSIRENLQFYGRLFSTPEEHINEVIDSLKLRAWSDTSTKQLSHGLRKRGDIARALLHDPNLLLLDEPFSGLDESTRSFIVDYLKTLQAKTLVVASHSLDLAKSLCKRFLSLKSGTLVEDASF